MIEALSAEAILQGGALLIVAWVVYQNTITQRDVIRGNTKMCAQVIYILEQMEKKHGIKPFREVVKSGN